MKTGVQFIKFGIVGVLNTVVQFGVFFVLFRSLAFPMLVASGLGYIAGIVNSYFVNRVWTFEIEERKTTREFIRFALVSVIAMGMNLSALKILVAEFGLVPEIGQVLAIGFSMTINFAGNKWWTFRESTRQIN